MIDSMPAVTLLRTRPRFAKQARVMLSGATIDTMTDRLIQRWLTASKLSAGLLHDQVYAFAKKKGFKPTKKAT